MVTATTEFIAANDCVAGPTNTSTLQTFVNKLFDRGRNKRQVSKF